MVLRQKQLSALMNSKPRTRALVLHTGAREHTRDTCTHTNLAEEQDKRSERRCIHAAKKALTVPKHATPNQKGVQHIQGKF